MRTRRDGFKKSKYFADVIYGGPQRPLARSVSLPPYLAFSLGRICERRNQRAAVVSAVEVFSESIGYPF